MRGMYSQPRRHAPVYPTEDASVLSGPGPADGSR